MNTDLNVYNNFCKNLAEGYILYNVDSTNGWGEYFVVVNIATVRLQGLKTYTALLIGLKKEDGKFYPRNTRIKITPDYAKNVPFLKYVGRCRFKLIPELTDVEVNAGLVAVYGTVDLRKFNEWTPLRKPKKRKYGKDGKPIIRKVEND